MAEMYKNAPTKTEAKCLLKESRIHWSKFLRLPYWDPTKFIVIDVMHNLFLGLVQYHIREVLQLDDSTVEEGAVSATEEEMAVGQ